MTPDLVHSLFFYSVLLLCALLTAASAFNVWALKKHAIGPVAAHKEPPAINALIPPSQSLRRLMIDFDYLPESPLARGWRLADYGHHSMDQSPQFRPLFMGETRLDMQVKDVFAMDYEIPPNAQLSTRVVYSIIYHPNTMMYLGFRLRARDGSFVENQWVKIQVGRNRTSEVIPPWVNEYVVWIAGDAEPDGWSQFDISLQDLIRDTWKRNVFELDAITKIRLRGSLAISPIRLYA